MHSLIHAQPLDSSHSSVIHLECYMLTSFWLVRPWTILYWERALLWYHLEHFLFSIFQWLTHYNTSLNILIVHNHKNFVTDLYSLLVFLSIGIEDKYQGIYKTHALCSTNWARPCSSKVRATKTSTSRGVTLWICLLSFELSDADI